MSEKIPLATIDSDSESVASMAVSSGSQGSNTVKQFKPSRAKAKSQFASSALGSSVYQGKIYTKRVRGYFQRLRKGMNFFLLALFLLIPWFDIDNRPAVYFDLSQQKFHIFSATFWTHDAAFLAYLLLLATFLLIAATLVVGRAWCGFTCPQTVWTFLFMWVEDKCEGDRNQRIKYDQLQGGNKKWLRKSAKHVLWTAISLITAYTFVGYFYPIKSLVADTLSFDMHYLGAFWVMFFTLATYLNAGWLREKVCLHMCPYARFQAVMYTQDTLVVAYDAARGESRGARKKGTEREKGLGDCVDCSLCVQVCPVDIDIRDGLQYPCIDCGLCIDACDGVMEKMGYEKGLIKFSSANDPQNKKSFLMKPKAIIISVLSVIACIAFVYSVMVRDSLSIDVIRDRSGELYYFVNDSIENVYTVKVNNKSLATNRFKLEIVGQSALSIISDPQVIVKAGEIDTLMVRVRMNKEDVSTTQQAFEFVIRSADQQVLATQASRFFAPRR